MVHLQLKIKPTVSAVRVTNTETIASDIHWRTVQLNVEREYKNPLGRKSEVIFST